MPDVISNTSCLIALDNIGMLNLLKHLYGQIIVTPEVQAEYGKPLDEWIVIQEVTDKNSLKILSTIVDIGEASTIALSLEIPDSLMIIDDLKARKMAEKLDLRFTGLFGVILKAKEKRIIPSVYDVIQKLKAINFRISDEMEKEVLRLSNE